MNRRLSVITIAATGLFAFAPAFGQAVNSEKLVATIVIAKRPPSVPRDKLDQLIVASVPTYQKISGLLAKFFTVNDDSYGGMYLWSDRKAAEAWFTPAWTANVKDKTGADPQVIYFDSPVQIDNRGPRH
ncbi:hypothetical protein [Bradyrhizobium guangdongense]|uniref:hypothetical protein n=1 Tax=Bradyrhizobium guangdongense TaxID=1325090 RepID=UPI0016426DAF|nr:hypothetical protein [Bradyrhizobium guangdongense]